MKRLNFKDFINRKVNKMKKGHFWYAAFLEEINKIEGKLTTG